MTDLSTDLEVMDHAMGGMWLPILGVGHKANKCVIAGFKVNQ